MIQSQSDVSEAPPPLFANRYARKAVGEIYYLTHAHICKQCLEVATDLFSNVGMLSAHQVPKLCCEDPLPLRGDPHPAAPATEVQTLLSMNNCEHLAAMAQRYCNGKGQLLPSDKAAAQIMAAVMAHPIKTSCRRSTWHRGRLLHSSMLMTGA